MKIIIYQSNFCQYGGVETMLYNWCWWLRNFFDINVLYCTGDIERIRKMRKLVKLEKYEEGKEYECDVFIRNSVWGTIPKGIKAKRMIEMRHANYKWLLDKGLLYQQYKDMGIKEIVGCGEYVSKMSTEALGDHPTTIKNILLPRKETKKVLHLISCTRIDQYKGWDRMLTLMQMLRNAKIKFDWKIFTNASSYKCDFEEVHFYKATYDIWDYLTDADYTILLSDSEGLPYTIQESLQYQVPCIVTDVGGCTELIKDGVNGYVVPLDMNFDINKILNIPKCDEYDNHALEDWLNYLGYKGEIDKQKIIDNYKEEKLKMVKVRCIYNPFYDDIELKRRIFKGEEFEVDEDRAIYLKEHNAVEILEVFKEEPLKVEAEPINEIKEKEKEKIEEIFDGIGKAVNKNIEIVETENIEKPKKEKPTTKKIK